MATAALAAIAGALAPGAASHAATNPITTSQIALVTDQEKALVAEKGSRYRYLVVRDTLHNQLEKLRSRNPNAEVIIYKNAGFVTREPSCQAEPFQGSGVRWCEAKNHEDWFLHDRSGNRLESSGYPGSFAMNVGSSGYQQAWLNSVRARLQNAHNNGSGVGYNGVWMDDVNLYPGHGLGGRIAEYSDAEYRAATVEFADVVSGALRGQGYTTMANVGMNPWDAAARDATLQVAGDFSVINREGFIRWGQGTLFTDPNGPAPHWEDEVALMEDIQARGAEFHALVAGQRKQLKVQRYARATFLLGWDGDDGAALAFRTTGRRSSFMKGWTTEIGYPTEARRQVGSGWARNYTGGTVVINARANGRQRFNLGAPHKLPSGKCAGSVRLNPTTGLVLKRC